VERTQEESPAMKAGIQCGDIISKIDGTPTESMQSYYTYLQTKKQGENLTITVLRKNSDGKYAEKDYKVTVGER
jgi:serine protease Do